MTSRVLLTALLVLATGCSSGPEPGHGPGPHGATHADLPSEPGTPRAARPTARMIAGNSHARLYSVRVTRTGGSFDVTAMWSLDRRPGRRSWHALAHSDDGFRTGRYTAGSSSKLQKAVWPSGPDETAPEAAADPGRHLMPWPAASLAVDVLAVVGGGDGATLFPFERVVRSVDGGATWQRFDLPRFGGERAYSGGHVVTADGRLVALLDHFSDDRPGRPSDRVHGLWTSDGGDWSAYSPLLPRMSPSPTPAPDGWSSLVSIGATADPDPVVWVSTWDHRLYVSTDGARSFREIPAR